MKIIKIKSLTTLGWSDKTPMKWELVYWNTKEIKIWNWYTPYSDLTNIAWGGGWIETVQIAWEQVEGTKFFEYNADGDKTVGNVKISLEVANTGADFIVKAYKNWTDLSKDITIDDGGWTAVNNRYVASLAIGETLADWDVFELKINQVWSDVAGSDFLALINIS